MTLEDYWAGSAERWTENPERAALPEVLRRAPTRAAARKWAEQIAQGPSPRFPGILEMAKEPIIVASTLGKVIYLAAVVTNRWLVTKLSSDTYAATTRFKWCLDDFHEEKNKLAGFFSSATLPLQYAGAAALVGGVVSVVMTGADFFGSVLGAELGLAAYFATRPIQRYLAAQRERESVQTFLAEHPIEIPDADEVAAHFEKYPAQFVPYLKGPLTNFLTAEKAKIEAELSRLTALLGSLDDLEKKITAEFEGQARAVRLSAVGTLRAAATVLIDKIGKEALAPVVAEIEKMPERIRLAQEAYEKLQSERDKATRQSDIDAQLLAMGAELIESRDAAAEAVTRVNERIAEADQAFATVVRSHRALAATEAEMGRLLSTVKT